MYRVVSCIEPLAVPYLSFVVVRSALTAPCALPYRAMYRLTSPCNSQFTVPFTTVWICAGQVTWISGQKGDGKKAGILAAVAKLPTLLKKLEAAATAAVGSKGKEEVNLKHIPHYLVMVPGSV